MTLWNPYARDVLGAPVLGVAPASLRCEGVATAAQLAQARMAYQRFCMTARTSRVPNPTEQGTLPDGSRYTITVLGPATYMTLWPVGSKDVAPYVAWTSFVGTSFLPIWDRPRYAFPDDPIPDPGPEPKYPRAPDPGLSKAVGYGIYIEKTPRVVGYVQTTTGPMAITNTKSKLEVVLSDITWENGAAVTTETGRTEFPGSRTLTPTLDHDGNFVATRVQWDKFASPGSLTPWEVEIDGVVWNAYGFIGFGGENFWRYSVDYIDYFGADPEYAVDKSPYEYYRAQELAVYEFNLQVTAAHEAAMKAWRDGYQPWLDNVYAPWAAAYDAWIKGHHDFYTPALAWRAAARPPQIEAVRAFLLRGISGRHLTARLLSFPFNISYRSTPTSGSGGSVSHGAPTSDTWNGRWPTTLADAQPRTVVPAKSFFPTARVEPAHELRRDFMPAGALFCWSASGTYDHVGQNWLYHQGDSYEIQPLDMENISVSYPADYPANVALERSEDSGLVIDADIFVPAKTKLSIVFFEYEVYDPYSRLWVWTPCPEMVLSDSIWVTSHGTYMDDGMLEQRFTQVQVRAARPWRMVTQVRKDDGSWEPAQDASLSGLDNPAHTREYGGLARHPELYPTAVVIAENLHAAAAPSKAQATAFPFGAKFLWSGDPVAIGQAATTAWEDSAAEAQQQQFIAQALRLTNRLNA